MPILSVKGLKKSYKKGFIPKSQQVLKGLDFSIEPGVITGFLGGNGAGKTTTMKCILGLAFPDEGEVEFFDGQKLSSEVKRRIGFLPERPYFYDYLTGEEFLRFYSQLTVKVPANVLKDRINTLLKKVDLLHARNKKLKDYSKGMLQKIGLAQALIHEPEFIILDEPMSGLDPDGRMYINEIISETAKEGTGVFFSSHLLHDVERLCKKLVIIKDGLVVFEGETEGLLEKMGNASVITYLKEHKKESVHVANIEALQSKLDELRNSRASILDIRQDRSLEEAFKKIGLRGTEL